MIRRTKRNKVVHPSWAMDSILEIPVPEGLAYLPFQKAGIEYAVGHADTLIGDEPGLGKTIQAIGTCNYLPTIRNILCIVPAFLKPHWRDEFKKWDIHNHSIGIVEGTKGEFPNADVVIINYDILKAHRNALRSWIWDVVIVDEVHKLKSRKADRTREVFGGIKRNAEKKIIDRVAAIPAQRRIFLTGTPSLNGKPQELWGLVQQLDPEGLGADWFQYAKRYCGLLELKRWDRDLNKEVRFGWKWDGAENLDELQDRMRQKFMVRRLKKDVLTQLPEKRRMVITLAPDAKMKKLIKQELKEFESFRAKRENGDFLPDFTQFSSKMLEIGLLMVEPTIEVAESELEEQDKIVIMCYHKEVARGIAEHFGKLARVVDGNVPPADRVALVKEFQEDPEIRVLVGTIDACGVGLTMTAAQVMLFPERKWVPGDVTQAEDRIHRIGQTGQVVYKHLVLEGSLAERQIRTLIDKQDRNDLMLDKPKE